MPIAFVLESRATREQIDALNQRIAPDGKSPEGQLYHAGGPTETGWIVVDVWESEEAFQRFAERATPVARELGLPTDYQVVRRFQVYDILKP